MLRIIHRLRKSTVENAYVALAFASLCWSGNHVVGRALAGHFPPLTLATIRWLVPMVMLWFIARAKITQDWPMLRQHWRIVLWLAFTGGLLFSALQYIALQHTTALNASIMNSLVPVLIITSGALIFRDRISFLQILGISGSLLGVVVIITQGDPRILTQLKFNIGDLLVIFTMASFAVYVTYLRLRPPMHWLSFLFVIAAISVAGTMPLAAWEILSGQAIDLTAAVILAALYIAIFPGLLAFAAWNRGVELIGPSRSAPFLHLVPLYTAALGGMFLREQVMVFHVVGLVLILLGVWLAAKRPRTIGAHCA
jgi:drug/metabolite transporter (DMT)-like permease